MTNRSRTRPEAFEDPDPENESAYYGFQRMDFTDVENSFTGMGMKFDKNELLAEKMLHKDFYNDFGDLFTPEVTSEYKPSQPTKSKEK
uniref:Uncharacterized protein n=1 Tax=Acrobeloides nanus TaxID=290746 RepID=A0A914CJW3_9BILA